MAKIIRREWTSREMTKLGWRQFIQQINVAELVEVLFGLADRQRVILLVHLRLNPITLLDLSHHLGLFIYSQTYFLAVLPLDEILPVSDAHQFALDRRGAF